MSTPSDIVRVVTTAPVAKAPSGILHVVTAPQKPAPSRIVGLADIGADTRVKTAAQVWARRPKLTVAEIREAFDLTARQAMEAKVLAQGAPA